MSTDRGSLLVNLERADSMLPLSTNEMNISLQDTSRSDLRESTEQRALVESKVADKFLAESYAVSGLDVEDFIYRVAGTMGDTIRSSTVKTSTE